MFEFSIYIPKRKAVKNRQPALLTFGIGNEVRKNKYVPVIDIDDKYGLKTIISTGYRLLNPSGYMIVSTTKGYHVIFFTIVNWSKLNSLWSKLKNFLDRKWITLQRKRGYAVLRVAGKYRCNDLKIMVFVVNDFLDPLVCKYLRFYLKVVDKKYYGVLNAYCTD